MDRRWARWFHAPEPASDACCLLLNVVSSPHRGAHYVVPTQPLPALVCNGIIWANKCAMVSVHSYSCYRATELVQKSMQESTAKRINYRKSLKQAAALGYINTSFHPKHDMLQLRLNKK
jgi:hypothetical protein